MQASSLPLLLLCSRRGPRSPPPHRLRGGGHLDGWEREQLHHVPPPHVGRGLPLARWGARVAAGAGGSGGARVEDGERREEVRGAAPTRAPWRRGRRRVHGGEQRRRHLQVQREGAADRFGAGGSGEVRPEAWAGGARETNPAGTTRERRSRRVATAGIHRWRVGAARARCGWERERERGRTIKEG